MSTEEEYNKLIADKLHARRFEASEQDWDAALALIEAHDKKKKRRFLFWLFPGAGLVTIGILLFAIYPFEKNDQTAFVQIKPEDVKAIAPLQAESEKNIEKITTKEENNDRENKVKADIEAAEQKDILNTEAKARSSKIADKNRTAEFPNVTASENSTTKTNPENNALVVIKKLKPKKIVNADASQQKENVAITNSKPKKEEPKKEMLPLVTHPVLSKENEPAITTIASSITATPETTLLNPILNDSIPEEKKDSMPAITNAVAKVDSAAKVEKFLDPIVPSSSRFEFYALGAGQLTPVKDQQKLIDKINPMGGLYFVRSFVNGVGFGSGIFYAIYSANTLNPRIYRSVSQEFGYKASVIEIAPEKLHYGRMPVFATYSFKKNRIFLGVQASYMVLCRSSVSTYSESYKVISDQKTERTFGYNNGISKFDVSLMFAYSRTVYQKFGLGVGMDYGFKDTKNNTYFGSTAFERNISFQLLLTYKIR